MIRERSSSGAPTPRRARRAARGTAPPEWRARSPSGTAASSGSRGRRRRRRGCAPARRAPGRLRSATSPARRGRRAGRTVGAVTAPRMSVVDRTVNGVDATAVNTGRRGVRDGRDDVRGVRVGGGDGRGARRVRRAAGSPACASWPERAGSGPAGRPDLARASPRPSTAPRPLTAVQRGSGRSAASSAGPVPGSAAKSPAAWRTLLSSIVSCVSSCGVRPERPKSTSVTAFVASSSTARPPSVISTSVARRSVGCGTRRTSPSACSRSTMLVTLVGCSCSRSPITRMGSRPWREKLSSTSAS